VPEQEYESGGLFADAQLESPEPLEPLEPTMPAFALPPWFVPALEPPP